MTAHTCVPARPCLWMHRLVYAHGLHGKCMPKQADGVCTAHSSTCVYACVCLRVHVCACACACGMHARGRVRSCVHAPHLALALLCIACATARRNWQLLRRAPPPHGLGQPALLALAHFAAGHPCTCTHQHARTHKHTLCSSTWQWAPAASCKAAGHPAPCIRRLHTSKGARHQAAAREQGCLPPSSGLLPRTALCQRSNRNASHRHSSPEPGQAPDLDLRSCSRETVHPRRTRCCFGPCVCPCVRDPWGVMTSEAGRCIPPRDGSCLSFSHGGKPPTLHSCQSCTHANLAFMEGLYLGHHWRKPPHWARTPLRACIQAASKHTGP